MDDFRRHHRSITRRCSRWTRCLPAGVHSCHRLRIFLSADCKERHNPSVRQRSDGSRNRGNCRRGIRQCASFDSRSTDSNYLRVNRVCSMAMEDSGTNSRCVLGSGWLAAFRTPVLKSRHSLSSWFGIRNIRASHQRDARTADITGCPIVENKSPIVMDEPQAMETDSPPFKSLVSTSGQIAHPVRPAIQLDVPEVRGILRVGEVVSLCGSRVGRL